MTIAPSFFRNVALLIAYLSLPWSTAEAQERYQIRPAELSTKIKKATEFAAHSQGIGIDPKITEEITTDAGNFVWNFCGEYSNSSADPCESTINNTAVLREIVGKFLKDAATLAPQIETVASRLARRTGNTMADAGWSSAMTNNVGVLLVPKALQTAELSMRTAMGDSKVGSKADKILITAGRHVLIASFDSGEKNIITAQVSPRKIGIWGSLGKDLKSAVGRIEASTSNFCEPSATKELKPPTYGFNFGRATISEPPEQRIAHLVPAASQAGLTIQIIDATKTCVQECLTGLGSAFAEAIAVWRSGCSRCEKNALSVLKINKSVWLDQRAAERLRELPVNSTPETRMSKVGDQFPLFGLYPNEDRSKPLDDLDLRKPIIGTIQRPSAPSLSVPLTTIIGYEQIDHDQELIAKLCNVSNANSVQWVASAQAFLCGGVASPSQRLRPILEIRNENTDCQDDDAVACAVEGGRIQINTGKFAYDIPWSNGNVILGATTVGSAYDIRPILIHEVGHWFGVPHPEQVGLSVTDIMAGTMGERDCVTAESLTMLNNATDDRWPFRAKKLQGLLPPKISTRTKTTLSSER